MLDARQRQRFDDDGFLVLEGFVDAAACDELRERAVELVEAFDPGDVRSIFTTHEQERVSDDYFLTSGDTVRFFFEEEAFDEAGELRQAKELSINKIGHAQHDLDPVFERFSRTPAIAAVAAGMGLADPVLLQSMYIFKQPSIGGEVIGHQDSTFLFTEPLTCRGLWFAIEDATLDNGCLWALPGGHRLGLKRVFKRAPGGGTVFDELDTTPFPEEEMVPLEVAKGTLVLLHGELPHRSGPNRSPHSRHAYSLHLIERGAGYPEWNWLQRGPALPLRGF